MAWWDDLFKPKPSSFETDMARSNQVLAEGRQLLNPAPTPVMWQPPNTPTIRTTNPNPGLTNPINAGNINRNVGGNSYVPPRTVTPSPMLNNVQMAQDQLRQFQNYGQTPVTPQVAPPQSNWLQNIFQPQQPAQLNQNAVGIMQQPEAQDIYQQITGQAYGGAEPTPQGGFNAVAPPKQAQVTPQWQGVDMTMLRNDLGINPITPLFGGPEGFQPNEWWNSVAKNMSAPSNPFSVASAGLFGGGSRAAAAAGQVPSWLSGTGNWLKGVNATPLGANWQSLVKALGLGGGVAGLAAINSALAGGTKPPVVPPDKSAADKAKADQAAADAALLEGARGGGEQGAGTQPIINGRFWSGDGGQSWQLLPGAEGGQDASNAAQVRRDHMAEIMAQIQSQERIAQMNNAAQLAQIQAQAAATQGTNVATSAQNMASMYAADPYKYWAQMGQLTPEAVAELTGGQVEAGQPFKGVPLSHPSAQWWNNLLPSEQEQILGALNWMGINPEDWFEMQKRTIPGMSSRQITPSWGR